MNVKLNVTRFNNEDVIATSQFCGELGTFHFQTTGVGLYDAEHDQTTAPGTEYFYVRPGVLTPGSSTLTMTVPGEVEIPAGVFFYYDGQGYILCEKQEHGR